MHIIIIIISRNDDTGSALPEGWPGIASIFGAF